jgi:hypothetical protein
MIAFNGQLTPMKKIIFTWCAYFLVVFPLFAQQKPATNGHPLGWRVGCRECNFQWSEESTEDLLKIRLGD